MKKNSLPKVLVVSTNAWRDNTGINTLINFFKNWEKDKLAQIYTKTLLPKTTVCNTFFRISENAVIKSLIKPGIKTGSVVQNETAISEENSQAAKSEAKLYSHAGKKASLILSICRELVWTFAKWKTKELNQFIDNYDADVLFIPIYPTIYMSRLQKYVINRTKKPVVSYLADDNYTYKAISKNPLSLIHRFVLRKYVKYIINNSTKLMVIAPKQKEECDKTFGTNCEIMTKGIDFSQISYQEKPLNNPIKMVYTGKLIIGRWLSLAKIAEAMGNINKGGTKVELDIYTTDTLTSEQQQLLNRNGASVKGSLTLEEVQEVQRQADILIFVESLEKKFRYAARLSFSTKITDYLKNGKCIFAIGDSNIAPIDYFNRYDSALTASSYDEIERKLNDIISNPQKIAEYSKKAFDCAYTHHNEKDLAELFKNTLMSAQL